MCHGNPGRGDWGMMSSNQHMALVSGTLSTAGAGFAIFGCGTTGLSCGLAAVLVADAGRQFHIAATGNDPLINLALSAGADSVQAAQMALAADFLTAVFSINAAYKGILLRSTNSVSAGSLGAAGTDVSSTIHTIRELNRSVGASE